MKDETREPGPRPQGEILEVSRKIRERLRERIRDSEFTQRGIERELGLSKGYLSHVLKGTTDLKFAHLFSLLEVLGVRPGNFFAEVTGEQPPTLPEPAPTSPSPAEQGAAHCFLYLEARHDMERRIERCEEALSAARGRGLVE